MLCFKLKAVIGQALMHELFMNGVGSLCTRSAPLSPLIPLLRWGGCAHGYCGEVGRRLPEICPLHGQWAWLGLWCWYCSIARRGGGSTVDGLRNIDEDSHLVINISHFAVNFIPCPFATSRANPQGCLLNKWPSNFIPPFLPIPPCVLLRRTSLQR